MTAEEWVGKLTTSSSLPPAQLRTEETIDHLITAAMGHVRTDHAHARMLATAAAKLARSLAVPRAMGRAQRMLGHVRLLAGRSAQAVAYYEAAWEHFHEDPLEQSHTAVAMIQALAYVGNYDRAFSVAGQALATYREHRDTFRAARIEANLGNILHRLDRHEEAQAHFQRALPVLAEHQAEADLAIVMRNYGVVLMGLQKYVEADAMYEQARTVFAASSQTLLLYEIDLNRAFLHGRQGRMRQALSQYRSLQDQLPAESGFEIGHCLLDQADFLLETGFTADALAVAGRAAQVFEGLKARFELGKAALLQARAQIRRNEREPARANIALARRNLRNEPSANWRALLHQTQSELHELAGEKGRALRQIQLAADCGPSQERMPLIQRMVFGLALETGHMDRAEKALAAHPEPDLRAQFLRETGREKEALGAAREALAAYDALRGRADSIGLRRAAAASQSNALRECFRTLHDPAERLAVAARLKDQTLAEIIRFPESRADLRIDTGPADEEDLAAKQREASRLHPHEQVLNYTLPTLPPNHRFIEFFTDRDEVYAFVIEGLGVREYSLGAAERFRDEGRFFHLHRLRDSDHGLRLTLKALTRISELMMPVLARAPKNITIGRDHALMGLPIHALPYLDGYLSDHYDVTYAPSASVWASLRACTHTPRQGAALIGAADSLAPQIEQEIAEVSQALGTEPSPNLAAFESQAEEARILHIAAHGIVREDQPMFSAMVIGHEKWTVFDVLQLRLHADLAVMSGCSTGISLTGETLDSQGFIEALLASGCQSVVASLWDTSDAANLEWMVHFYSALKKEPVISAARQANQAIRERWPNPGHWAAFALFGVQE